MHDHQVHNIYLLFRLNLIVSQVQIDGNHRLSFGAKRYSERASSEKCCPCNYRTGDVTANSLARSGKKWKNFEWRKTKNNQMKYQKIKRSILISEWRTKTDICQLVSIIWCFLFRLLARLHRTAFSYTQTEHFRCDCVRRFPQFLWREYCVCRLT